MPALHRERGRLDPLPSSELPGDPSDEYGYFPATASGFVVP